MSENTLILKDADFEPETAKGVVLIDFWAPRCPPCRVQGPIIDRIATAMSGKAKVGKYNVDEESEIADRFGFKSIPTLIILKDGVEIERFTGLQTEQTLMSALERHTK